jgi:membrane fusion protein (multidrug efflux system)
MTRPYCARFAGSLLGLLCSLGLTACGEGEPAKAASESREHVVEVASAEVQTVQSRLIVAGSLEAQRRVRLYNEISGIITQLSVREGDRVASNQLLVAIDADLIQAELDKASAQQAQAKVDYERLIKLKPRQLASDEEIARASTALDIASADVKLQRTRLAKTRILAPFSGVITERLYEPGDVVAVNSNILTLIDPASINLKVNIPESWLPLVRTGDTVAITIDALGGSAHAGQIARIYPTIDASTRKGSAEIAFSPLPNGARAGQLARVELNAQAQQQLVIPSRAIHHDAQGAYVYRYEADASIKKIYVEKGLQHGEVFAINGGLSNADKVVIKGFIGLRDGKKVTVFDASAEASLASTPQAK